MQEEKLLKPTSYIKKFENKELKLVVFYNGKAIFDSSSWTLNEFLNHQKFEIHEVIFAQGINKEHDSFHIWFKKIK